MIELVLITVFLGIFMIVTILNAKAKVPIECRDNDNEACSSCHSYSSNMKKEVV